MIEEYKFGIIVIDGKTYSHDVEVRYSKISSSDLEVLEWRRGESHVINEEDIRGAMEQNPDIIVIGTGESGVAKVIESAKEAVKSKGIELIIDLTEQAVKTFNIINEESEEEEGEQKKVIGLFHLTC